MLSAICSHWKLNLVKIFTVYCRGPSLHCLLQRPYFSLSIAEALLFTVYCLHLPTLDSTGR